MTLGLVATTTLFAQTAPAVEADWIMYQDPILRLPTYEVRFRPNLVPLWRRALECPERDLKRRAAATIALAHAKGLPGLEATIQPLMDVFEQASQDRLVRLNAARALVALDARQAAPLLCQTLLPGDLDLAELVEPALARWGYSPMREVWLERLNAEVTLGRMHVLAIRGLTALGEVRSLPRLLQLAQDDETRSDIRVQAATALGQMQQTGLEEAARALLADKTPRTVVDRLVAARMLSAHRGISHRVALG